jgi:DNA-binding transcriptional regulator YdaS (Cro superfamily)
MYKANQTPLRKWLDDNSVTLEEMGRRIGRDKSTVCRIVNNQMDVTRPVASAIFLATGGKVTPNDLYQIGPDYPGAATAKVA